MPEPKTCSACHFSGQMVCDRCGLAWDANDPEPPTCLTDEHLRRARAAEAFRAMRKELRGKDLLEPITEDAT